MSGNKYWLNISAGSKSSTFINLSSFDVLASDVQIILLPFASLKPFGSLRSRVAADRVRPLN